MQIRIEKKGQKSGDKIILIDSKKDVNIGLTALELKVVNKAFKKNNVADLSDPEGKKLIVLLDLKNKESNRKIGATLIKGIQGKVAVIDSSKDKEAVLSFLEGAMLMDYEFVKYKSDYTQTNKVVSLISKNIGSKDVEELKVLTSAVFQTRDWVNEPVNQLNTQQYVDEIAGFKKLKIAVEVYRKSKLQSLNMGGIIGVNQGSVDEPALVKCEWKPKNAKNKKPIVLIGKGVLFDTGGINIKTGNFMTDMKADMGGSSTVLGTIKAVAEQKLPVHIIVLTPITENRINGKELVPGDVITMHNGKTVEVLNTDAEGRLILADALSFAKKFNPSLVIDAATLTGSAARLTGHNGGVVLGNAPKAIAALKKSGEEVYERLVELPMWEEFEDTLKSDIADINNLGSGEGQAVCAGFFLKNFVDYPWVHLDIAGPAFRGASKDYLPKGGTGFGVRLLYQFFKNKFVS